MWCEVLTLTMCALCFHTGLVVAKTQDEPKIFNNLLFRSQLWSKVVDCSAGASNFAFSGPGGSFPTVAIGAASCTDGR